MFINDVVIHVNEDLNKQAQQDLEDHMREIRGVIAPRFNDRRSHLMIVAYDADQIRALELLDEIRHQGYHAQHCGA